MMQAPLRSPCHLSIPRNKTGSEEEGGGEEEMKRERGYEELNGETGWKKRLCSWQI